MDLDDMSVVVRPLQAGFSYTSTVTTVGWRSILGLRRRSRVGNGLVLGVGHGKRGVWRRKQEGNESRITNPV